MSLSHNEAVLDRVLTRIVSAGNQKTQGGRSPARVTASVLQRDTGPVRSVSGVDKRRAGSTAKLHASYRVANPAFGSSSTRDSSLAGTNTVVPQIVFSRGVLKGQGSLLLQLPSAAAVANSAANAAAQNSTAGAKTSAVILRQQPHRHGSPQPHLRAPRSSSPQIHLAGGTNRSRSSPGDKRGGDGSGSPRVLRAAVTSGGTGDSPRGLLAGRNAGAARSRSSPRDQHSGDGSGSPRGLRASVRVTSPRELQGAHVTSPNGRGSMAHGESSAAAAADGMSILQRGGRGANTITRTAALRALKQQRATTPDVIAELRASAAANASPDLGAPIGHRAAGGGDTLPRQVVAHRAAPADAMAEPGHADGAAAPSAPVTDGQAGGSAIANADTHTCGEAAGPMPTSGSARTAQHADHGCRGQVTDKPSAGHTVEASPHPPASLPAQHRRQQQLAQETEHHLQKQQRVQLQPQPDGQQPCGGAEPIEPCAHGGEAGSASRTTSDQSREAQSGRASPRSSDTVNGKQVAAASASSACRGGAGMWGLGQEASVRSPSPRRGRAAGAGWSAAAAESAAAAGVVQRQQRAMRQHVQRQVSPSPGRRQGAVRASLDRAAGLGAGRAVFSPAQPQRRSDSAEASWQNDVVLAAQSRIRRLEDQVIGLSAQVAELQASHADLEFQLEEEQQQQHARKAAGRSSGKPAAVAVVPSPSIAAAEAAQAEREQRQREQLLQELQEQVKQLQQQRQARDVEMNEQIAKARTINDTLARQNRALYSTLEETLSAAEHAAQELKQLRGSHAQLQAASEASQKEASQVKDDLDLRERALSAVQTEFSTLRRRHDEVLAAAEAARRDAALRDGRMRREVDAATQEAATLATQLAKLQREHQQLHCRKAEKDRHLAALTKRAETQQEQLSGAERLAQEQAALVRELESRATLLRNRNSALDRAVSAEKEARQAAQEQVRQMEEEIALLVAIVRQSDPTLETLGRYKADPAAAAAMAAAAGAAAAAALLQASPSPPRGPRVDRSDADVECDAASTDANREVSAAGPADIVVVAAPYSSRGGSSSGSGRRPDPFGHSVVTITAGTVSSGAGDVLPVQQRGPAAPAPLRTAHPPPPYSVPGMAALTVRAPPPGTASAIPHLQSRPHDDNTAASAAQTNCVGAADADTGTPQPAGADETPKVDPGSAGIANRRYGGSRDSSPMAFPYPAAKLGMTGGVFLSPHGSGRGRAGGSPRAGSPVPGSRSQSAGGAGLGGSPQWVEELRLAAAAASARSRRTSPRSNAGGARGRRGSDSGCKPGGTGPGGADVAPGYLAAASMSGVTKIAPAGSSSCGRPLSRRSATPPGNSASRSRGGPAVATAVAYVVSTGRGTRTGSPDQYRRPGADGAAAASIGGGGPCLQSSSPVMAVSDGEGDRVFWAKPRRSNRPISTGSAAGTRGGGRGGQELGYAAMSARRAWETSVLTGASGRSHSCGSGAVELTGPSSGAYPVLQRLYARRARTPEPRTAAAWIKMSEDSATGGRKRSSTPDGRITSTGRGSYKLGPPGLSSTSSLSYSDAAAELAALLQPSPRAFDSSRVALKGILKDQSSLDLLEETRAFKRSNTSGGSHGSCQSLELDEDSKTEMASPARLGRHACLEQRGGGMDSARSVDSGTYGNGPEGSALPSGAVAGADGKGQPEIFRASYAFDSPMHRNLHKRPASGAAGAQEAVSASPAASAVGTAAIGVDAADGGDSASVDDPLGAALRSLQQRQVQLLQQLAATPQLSSTPAGTHDAPAFPGSPPPQLLYPPAASPPTVASFSFAMPQHGQMSPDRAVQADNGESNDGSLRRRSDDDTGERRGQTSGRRRSVSFADEVLPEDNNSVQSQPARHSEGGGAMNLPSVRYPRSQSHHQPPEAQAGPMPASLPPQTPPSPQLMSPMHSPYRPSVTAAAAAAAAAGAGVGGPLTALLDQLESGRGTWRTTSPDPVLSTVVAAMGAAAAAAASPRQQSQRAQVTAVDEALLLPPQQIMTHFSLAAILEAASRPEHQPLQKLERQPALPVQPQDNADGLADDGSEEESSDISDALLFAAGDDEEVLEEAWDGEEEDSCGDDEGRGGESPVVVSSQSGCSDEAPRVDTSSKPEGSSIVAPQNEQSGGGSDDYVYDDYSNNPAGQPTGSPRLGVSLYDNVAFDADLLANSQAGAVEGSARAGQHPWESPLVWVPTLLAEADASGRSEAVPSAGAHPDLFSPPSHWLSLQMRVSGDSHTPCGSVDLALRDSVKSGFLSTASRAASLEPVYPDLPAKASQVASGGSSAGVLAADERGAVEGRLLSGGAPGPSAHERMVFGSPGAPFASSAAGDGNAGVRSSFERMVPPLVEATGPLHAHLDALLDGSGGIAAPSPDATTSSSLAALFEEQRGVLASARPAATATHVVAALGEGSGTLAAATGLSAEDDGAAAVMAMAVAAPEEDARAGEALGVPVTPLATVSAHVGAASTGAIVGRGAASAFGNRWLGRTEPTLLERQQQPVASRTTHGPSSASSSSDWLQQRRPQSPSVKPLSLAEVLRRPPTSSTR